MARTLALLLALLVLAASANSETPPADGCRPSALFAPVHTDNRLFRSLTGGSAIHSTARSCCKVCSVGKACGNTCISRNKTGHADPGCACDALLPKPRLAKSLTANETPQPRSSRAIYCSVFHNKQPARRALRISTRSNITRHITLQIARSQTH